ncbi:MAG: hypothetical protein KatS3mg105_3728 [Gemmatales bacterium]|nr:MAG: hypothetical protein KatS3mg105_3728 [Gemmatales bacterium]
MVARPFDMANLPRKETDEIPTSLLLSVIEILVFVIIFVFVFVYIILIEIFV